MGVVRVELEGSDCAVVAEVEDKALSAVAEHEGMVAV